MKELRRVDDNVINRLNSNGTHAEGVCSDFFKQMTEAYAKRDEAINYCLKVKKIPNSSTTCTILIPIFFS